MGWSYITYKIFVFVPLLESSHCRQFTGKILTIQTRPVKWHENCRSVMKKQLWSRHTNFCKKSRKFELPAVRLKGFFQSCTCVSLTGIKNINISWHLIPLSDYPIRKPSVAEILHSLFTYTPVRDDPNDNRCTYNIDNQYCLLLNILGHTSFSGIILILSFKSYPIFKHLTSFMEQLLMYFGRHKQMETNVVKGQFTTKSFRPPRRFGTAAFLVYCHIQNWSGYYSCWNIYNYSGRI